MSDDRASAPQAQTAPRALVQDLAKLTKAVRQAVASWEHTSRAMQETQRGMQQTLEDLTDRVERLELELRALRRAGPGLS